MPEPVSIVIPTYNERDNIVPLVERLHSALAGLDYDALFVDDDSRDGTAEAANSLSGKYPVRAIVRKGKKGLASAVVDGAKEARNDIILVMDADLQHPPEVIPAMLKEIDQGADMVIASRYIPGGGCQGWSLVRRIISKGAIFLSHLLLPATRPVSDPMSGFFVFRKDRVDLARLNPSGFKILLEMLMMGRFQKTAEVPYTFVTRERGESKLSARQQVDYLKHLWSLMRRTGELMRFIKFILVGASGVVVNYGLYWLLTRYAGFSPLEKGDGGILSGNLAMIISIETSILSNFLLNNFFTFADRNTGGVGGFFGRMVNFFLMCNIGGLIQIGVANLLTLTFGIDDLISILIAIVVATLWNFLMNNRLTWKK